MAGIIDGEGYVTFHRTPTVQVETVSPVLVYTPKRLFGGSITERIKKNTRVFRWSMYGKNAIELLALLLPYLRYKRPQAEILIYFGDYPKNSAMRALTWQNSACYNLTARGGYVRCATWLRCASL